MQRIRIIGKTTASMPISLHGRKHGHRVTGLPKDETTWRQGRTVWPAPAHEHTKPPKGTAPSLGALGRFLNRVAEIEAIAKTQFLELPTVAQELAATGVSSYSINQPIPGSKTREPMEEVIASSTGAEYALVDYAAISRRIEWERFAKQCSLPRKGCLLPDTEHGQILFQAISRDITPELAQHMAKRLKKALDGRTAEDLQNDIDRVHHFGRIGSCLYGAWTGEQVPEQSMDDLGAEDLEVDEANGGPEELGLHTVAYGRVMYEPNEDYLWPDSNGVPVDATVIHTKEEWDLFWQERQSGWR